MDCFIVQVSIDTGLPTELGLALLESYRYHIWRSGGTDDVILFTSSNYRYGWQSINTMTHNEFYESVDLDGVVSRNICVIPVGTLEFCEEYIKRYYNKQYIKAINVPVCLRNKKYTRRAVYEIETSKSKLDKCFYKNESLFIKSAERCKAIEAGVFKKDQVDIEKLKEKTSRLFITQVIDTIAEWRVFVYRQKIIDCKQYLGDWRYNTELGIKFIEECISEYSKNEHSPAYTLDIGLLNTKEMAVIEVHNFISCGLYGFEDNRYVLNMIRNAYKYEIQGEVKLNEHKE